MGNAATQPPAPGRRATDESPPAADSAQLARRYAQIRERMPALCAGLSSEDLCVQSMPDASPGKWHLAHTSWFFEVMLLQPHARLQPLQPRWHYLFNSYYEALGPRHARPQRGLLTRPCLDEVMDYRHAVDARVLEFLARDPKPAARAVLELGLQHEQQHQELLVTDTKHLLSCNPLRPAWFGQRPDAGTAAPLQWIDWSAEGSAEIGAAATGFAFDNERPRHRVWLRPFQLASRPVSCGEYLEFIVAGGYRDPRWWLSDGWAAAREGGWQAPLYWESRDERWERFGVYGMQPVDPGEAVAHLSYYEADAYARFAGARLPSEAEWEVIARERWSDAAPPGLEPAAAHGFAPQVWQWTASAYAAYPGFRPLPGAAGEYNGKFMSGQMVLRGGSCATPPAHSRPSYRNFFPPAARWQFSGLRLARDLT